MPDWQWPGSRITAATDGDTVRAEVTKATVVDLGFGIPQTVSTTFPVALRLARIDTPAKSTPAGKRALARVVELTTGQVVHITTKKHYTYAAPEDLALNEYMAEVVLPNGRNLSDVLLAEGLAVPYDGKGKRPSALGAIEP